jgi:hypothetical protein
MYFSAGYVLSSRSPMHGVTMFSYIIPRFTILSDKQKHKIRERVRAIQSKYDVFVLIMHTSNVIEKSSNMVSRHCFNLFLFSYYNWTSHFLHATRHSVQSMQKSTSKVDMTLSAFCIPVRPKHGKLKSRSLTQRLLTGAEHVFGTLSVCALWSCWTVKHGHMFHMSLLPNTFSLLPALGRPCSYLCHMWTNQTVAILMAPVFGNFFSALVMKLVDQISKLNSNSLLMYIFRFCWDCSISSYLCRKMDWCRPTNLGWSDDFLLVLFVMPVAFFFLCCLLVEWQNLVCNNIGPVVNMNCVVMRYI